MPDARPERGRAGEDAASALYARRGFDVVARNWRCSLGELDLVARRGPLMVFCEVKARSGTGFGGGFAAVTPSKQRRIRRLAEAFFLSERVSATTVRFDVASVQLGDGAPEVELFEDAF